MIFTESENARVRKNIIHHLFSIAALCAVVFTNTIWLTGCVIYDSKDLAKFAKEQLLLHQKYKDNSKSCKYLKAGPKTSGRQSISLEQASIPNTLLAVL